ncbi:pisatin demethylase cytochrome P450 [Fusarium pseudocircinatum]|uniref:Pisatin demethylase cytochrome P450 n=1 Tax=Fusarium pseudocircinatum TaxID=56676 RepID=A0A8H5NXF1_9HYPO|nr:pisatin demethylase cytochrome P450 [Fusarium pseudocircinatum]
MILDLFLEHPWAYLTAALVGLLVTKLLVNKYGNGLNGIPGPALAAFTDLWRFLDVYRRRPEVTQIALHEKYGSVVRLGPNTVSIADPAAIQTIYAHNSGYTKSDFYPVQQTINKSGKRLITLFTSQDEKFHSQLRRSVSNAYAMSTLVQFEPFVDSTTTEFFKQLDQRYANQNDVLDFGTWLQYYAFDVIGELTYSKRLGFVDHGKDVDNIIGNLEWLLNYAAPVGQLPILDSLLLKNPLRLQLTKWGFTNSSSPVAIFARNRMLARVDPEKLGDMKFDQDNGRRDFLSRFLEANQKDPEFMNNDRVLALTVANMFAGSDTTAITFRAIFYYLMKNPDDMKTLMSELAEEEKAGRFTREDGLVSWNEVRDLPFLNAVVKEALRCHPAAGLMLERIVPARGLEVDGHHIPGGTIVGVNAWVLHRNKDIFGHDADRWRPSRWIEASTEQKRRMENYMFAFGAGSRTCIGKNISLLEMYKMVPALLRRYELEFPSADNTWHLNNENTGSRLLSHSQAAKRWISSWVGDDQRIPGVAIKPEHLANITSREKNHEYRKYRLKNGVSRLWLYETGSRGGRSSITHIAVIPPNTRHEPGSVPTEPFGIGNQDFNAGRKESKYGYPILELYELVDSVTLNEMKTRWGMGGAPMGWQYVASDLWEDRWGEDEERSEKVKKLF